VKPSSSAAGTGRGVDARSGKYLTFGLAGEEYGLEILNVREIIGALRPTAVPGMPSYVRGVINLRGKVIPVIDIRLKFGMAAAEQTAATCIIVVDVRGRSVGVVVDRVSEVLDVRGEEIEDAPELAAAVEQSGVLGIAKTRGRVRILLDIHQVLKEDTLAS
jgi:purine-binding chemotaxis protein CheW